MYDIKKTPNEEIFLIYFEDAYVDPILIFGRETAEKSFERTKERWNCYLFQCIENGSEKFPEEDNDE